jgi:hypothetical protein
MPFDAHKNLAVAAVATAPSPATTGTSITVPGGEGTRFPVPPFNATVWAATEIPTPLSAELVRVTAIAGDTFTIVRAQEGSPARAILVGDLIAATITAKTLTDIEGGQNFPSIVTGDVTLRGHILFTDTDAIDRLISPLGHTRSVKLSGGSNEPDGASVLITGNAHGWPGNLLLNSGATPGATYFYHGTESHGVMHPSGGFSWGTAVDPGAGIFSAKGFIGTATVGGTTTFHLDTANGADNKTLSIGGGGYVGNDRGACINLYGNEAGSPGVMDLIVGDVPNAGLVFYTGPGYTQRGKIHSSGAFTWGSTIDVVGAAFSVGPGGNAAGNAFVVMHQNGTMSQGIANAGPANLNIFYTTTGFAGYIQCSGTTTSFGTSSDARLKDDRGPMVVSDVLRRTVIHSFTWKADGTPGRGVFAQEAIAVAPFAVSKGTDERDDHGRLTHPWGVDYSKYVPDLIVGWQTHDAQVATLQAELSALTARVAMMSTRPVVRPSLFARVRDRIASWFAGGSPVSVPQPQFSKGL